jgi:hypothetical protein
MIKKPMIEETWVTVEGQELPLQLHLRYRHAWPSIREAGSGLALTPPEPADYAITAMKYHDEDGELHEVGEPLRSFLMRLDMLDMLRDRMELDLPLESEL